MVLSQGRVSLEQRLGTALQTAILLILSLFLCCFSNPTYLTHWRILYHTHSSRLPRLSSPGLGSLLNHLAEHCVVYWANWIPQYRNQKMLSSINRLRQLIARDKAKQLQLKNQLTKSHESSQPTIGGRDNCYSSFLVKVLFFCLFFFYYEQHAGNPHHGPRVACSPHVPTHSRQPPSRQ
jgi:hypothetical protein